VRNLDEASETTRIRQVLSAHARLPGSVNDLHEETDLYLAGMTSLAGVSVMLALEDAFDVEFPDRLLRKPTFASIRAIREALAQAVRDRPA
jgi:acyl carrier protein